MRDRELESRRTGGPTLRTPRRSGRLPGPEDPEDTMAETKFAEFIAAKKLDPRRIMAASFEIEKLRPEDRIIKLNKRRARSAETAPEGAAKETRKPRSGRPVTPRSFEAALTGGKLSGPSKTRLLQAVNRLLEQKKQEKVDLRQLF
jgi:hypothetical protein